MSATTGCRGTRFVIEELETRLLFSADLAQALGLPCPVASTGSQAPPPAHHLAFWRDPNALRGPAALSMAQMLGRPADVAPCAPPTDQATAQAAPLIEETTRHEIVFVDMSVAGADALVKGLQQDGVAQGGSGRTVQIVEIPAGSDGLALITQALSGLQEVDAVHILSHADGQGVQLGGTRLDASTLASHAQQLSAWSAALNRQADLLIYGCDLAATTEGRALVQDLALLTGADVAASNDLTANAAHGGDWTLEYRTGPIESASAVSAPLAARWDGRLLVSANGGQTAAHAATAGTAEATKGPRSVSMDGQGDPEVRVNTTTAGDQMRPSVAGNGGQAVVVWTGTDSGVSTGVFFQRQTLAGNQAPVFTGASSFVVAENTTAITVLAATDGDATPPVGGLVYSLVAGHDAAWFTVDAVTGALSFTAPPDHEAPLDADGDNLYQVRVQVSDGQLSTWRDLTVRVDNVKEAPTAVNDRFVLDEDQTLSGTRADLLGNDQDVDSPALSMRLLQGPAHGTLTVQPDGSWVYQPDADFHGSDAFVYVASDGVLDSDPATVQLQIDAVNDAPGMSAGVLSLAVGPQAQWGIAELTAQATDVEGDALTVRVVQTPRHGQLSPGPSGVLRYQADPGFTGQDSWAYVVSDG